MLNNVKNFYEYFFIITKKKKAIAVALIRGPGNGSICINGIPLDLIEPEVLILKIFEPFLLLGSLKFNDIDIRVRVYGGGKISQIYAIRQAISRGLCMYIEKHNDEHIKTRIKNIFNQYDRTLLVSDSRVIEPKKFGGKGARSKYQKSYR